MAGAHSRPMKNEAEIFALCDIVRQTAFELQSYLRHGHLEKVYENGLAHRIIFRVCSGPCDETNMAEMLQSAVQANRVVPALMGELKKRAIEVERLAC